MTDRHASSPGLSRNRSAEDGVSLIEVIVAMFVFAIISSGLIAGMVTITKTTAENRAKVVAANLASQDLDLVRAIADPFKVTSKAATTVAVGGRDYSVVRNVSWVSQAGADVSCNSSTNLYFLRVNVRVTWAGQVGTRSVQDDTILAPAARTNDSTSGAIAVSVVGSDGLPEPGITVSVTARSGGTGVTPTTQPAVTGTDGCTYATKLAPGDYVVTLSKSNWIDSSQVGSPVSNAPAGFVTVTAGNTQSAAFNPYDQAATFTTNYAKNYTASTPLLPVGLETNFIPVSGGTYTTTTPTSTVKLHPFTSGYSIVLGKSSAGTTTCSAVDPQAWTSGTSNGVALGNGVRASAAAAPGGSAVFGTSSTKPYIPMGVVLVKAPAGYYLGATQSTTLGTGNPGCGITGSVYTYAPVTTGSTMAVALPYGSWKLYYGTSTTSATQILPINLSVPTNAAGGGVAADGTVTLDPRPVAP